MQNLAGTVRRSVAGRGPLVASAIALGWSSVELVGLAMNHTTGPEVYGVLTAAIATGAAIGNLVLLRSSRMPVVVTLAVLAMWTLIALGGVAGTIAHIVGPVAGHGPVDLRPRPIAAPLVFTLLGLIGGTALFLGRRAAGRHPLDTEER